MLNCSDNDDFIVRHRATAVALTAFSLGALDEAPVSSRGRPPGTRHRKVGGQRASDNTTRVPS